MNVTFFTADDCYINSIDEIPEEAIIGGGIFTKNNISELLGCFKSGSTTQTDKLWQLSVNFSEKLSTIDQESIKELAVNWSEESSWRNKDINSRDLADHLLALKYGYSNSSQRIWVLFE